MVFTFCFHYHSCNYKELALARRFMGHFLRMPSESTWLMSPGCRDVQPSLSQLPPFPRKRSGIPACWIWPGIDKEHNVLEEKHNLNLSGAYQQVIQCRNAWERQGGRCIHTEWHLHGAISQAQALSLLWVAERLQLALHNVSTWKRRKREKEKKKGENSV